MEKVFISVIIPAHNEEKYIGDCLLSLSHQDYPKNMYEVIVVDNNSTDETENIASSYHIKLIKQNTGPVGAVRNAGAKKGTGNILAFIDADCVAPANWLTTGNALIQKKNDVYGGGYNLRPDPFWIEKYWLLKNKNPPKHLLGCCIFIRKNDFFTVGGFSEDITSGEDTELSVVLAQKNYNVIMTHKINVIHLGNALTLRNFIKRQTWHSENYFQNWRSSIKDPTFFLLALFIINITLLIISFSTEQYFITAVNFSFIIAIPLLFTIKRLLRSVNIYENLRNLPLIYFLDFLYLIGRSFGIYKSAVLFLHKIIERSSQQGD
jgi:glycosyltransferase involved in cell wall biosynthesis